MKHLVFATVVCVACTGAKLPTPKFAVLLPVPQFVPMPQWTAETVTVIAEEPAVKHTAKPIVRPMRIPHTRHYPPCICPEMCLAQHLANSHGMTNAEWNKERLWTSDSKMQGRHRQFHRDQPKPKVQQTTNQCCPGGNCGGGRSGWYPGKLLGR